MYDTLEEAQARIVELDEQVAELTNERDTLSQNNTDLAQQLEQVRTLNQKYFNKLCAQNSEPGNKNDNEEKEVPTCEEFAKTLTI